MKRQVELTPSTRKLLQQAIDDEIPTGALRNAEYWARLTLALSIHMEQELAAEHTTDVEVDAMSTVIHLKSGLDDDALYDGYVDQDGQPLPQGCPLYVDVHYQVQGAAQ